MDIVVIVAVVIAVLLLVLEPKAPTGRAMTPAAIRHPEEEVDGRRLHGHRTLPQDEPAIIPAELTRVEGLALQTRIRHHASSLCGGKHQLQK